MNSVSFEKITSFWKTNFIISIAKKKLYAYKLTAEQAANFSSRFPDLDSMDAEFGAENRLKDEEFYDGYVVILIHNGKFLIGKMHGIFELLNPQTNFIRDFALGQTALEQECLFSIKPQLGENAEQAFFKEFLFIVRDMPIAQKVIEYRDWGNPDGEPEEIDKRIKDKIVNSLLTHERVGLTVKERHFMQWCFPDEYRRMFEDD